MAKPHIVIVGANFAGLAAAKRLQHQQVTIIDPTPDFEFIPNIHELISAQKSPDQLRLARKELIHKLGHQWVQASVTSIDPTNEQLTTSDGNTYSYDACILAVGGVNNFNKTKGAAQFAYPFKSVNDCHKIGDRFKTLLKQDKSFVVNIIGGGSEGVEALGELLRYRKKATHFQIHLIEAQDRLLPNLSAKAHKEILKLCRKLNVDFHFGVKVNEVTATSVSLNNGKELKSDLTIWTGGVSPNPLLAASGLAPSPNAWISVNTYLQSKNFDNLFIAGDAADIKVLDSKQAYFAMESGSLAAVNVLNFLQHKALHKFHPIKRPYLYSFGDLSCFLIYQDLVLAGTALSIVKESIYQKTMADMQSNDPLLSLSKFLDQLVPQFLEESFHGIVSFLHDPVSFIRKPALRLL